MDNIRDNLYFYDCYLSIKDLWDYSCSSHIEEPVNKLLHSIVKDDFHKKSYGDDDIVKKLIRHPERIVYSWCYDSDCRKYVNTKSVCEKNDDDEWEDYNIDYMDEFIHITFVLLGTCEFDRDFYTYHYNKEYGVGLYENEHLKLTEAVYNEKLKDKINLSYEEFIDYISENF